MNSYDRYIANLSRSRKPADGSQWFAKMLALVFLVLCVAIGMAGIILPVIPGLLFLALAVIIAARLFPPLERRLRQNPMFSPYLDKTDHFWRLSLQGKVKFACWLTLKILWDSCVLLCAYLGKFVAWLRKDSDAL
ncbi:MAG: hypothetical protein RLZZ227_231 [Pseudomonadota bacterium]